MFEKGEGDFEEFMEDGEEDGHLGFAVIGEAISEGFEAWVEASCDEGGHVEDATDMTISVVANGSGGVDGGAGVMEARSDGKPGGGGASIGQMARQFSTEPASGAQADALDLAEALDVGVETWG